MSGADRLFGDTLAGRYVIERELGRGGNATVLLAEDQRHRRRVAIKLLNPELAALLGADRFLGEIEIIARLNHPHILPLFDSGEIAGLPYYVMPYVAGESLRAVLDRTRLLPIADVVRLLSEIGDALSYAHDQGIVHRDIKPENILIASDHAVIADFGIARAIDLSANERLTQAGITVGTPLYLSPEQAAGDHTPDPRSDIYSLGCVAYEMLAGDPPFTGETASAIIAKRFMERPVPLTQRREAIPHMVAAAVMRSLEREVDERFKTAKDFVKALNSANTTLSGEHISAYLGAPREGSVAVLPFTNMTADTESEYFADGMTEELINALSQVRSLRVTARTSSFAHKRSTDDVRTIGQKLGVAAVLEGGVRRVGSRLRVTAQLVSVSDGFQLWSERFDREMKDVFEIQDEISTAIVATVRGKLVGNTVPPARHGTPNLEAYHLYLKGRYYWYRRDLKNAIRYFEDATRRDPEYALAYCGIADTYSALALYGLVPTQFAYEHASASVQRALAIDPSSADVQYSRGLATFYFTWNLAEAARAFRAAIRANPTHAAAHAYLCAVSGMMGDELTTLTVGPRGQELEPMSPLINAVASMGYFFIRQPDLTEAACQQALSIDPSQSTASFLLAFVRAAQTRVDEAVELLDGAATRMNRIPHMLMLLGTLLWRAGRRDEALRVRDELYERCAAAPDADRPAAKAWLHISMGELDTGFELMFAGAAEHDPAILFLVSWPGFKEMRSDPRFEQLLHQHSLTAYGDLWRARSA